MLNNVLNLAQKMIRIQSDPDNKPQLLQILELVSEQLSDFTIETFEQNGYKSILAYNSATRPDKFKIILNGHLDVIPAKDFQYIPIIKGNRLYGAGSMDMKSNVACLVETFKNMANKVNYPLAIQLVTDEEVGGFYGTKYQIEQGVRADFVIAGETTNFDIVNQARGVLLLSISCKGKTAHGAYPWRGENAIWKMNNFLSTLAQQYPIPVEQGWATTINLAKIETNNISFNKIPDDCKVLLDIRFVPEDSNSIVENIKNLLPDGFEIEVIANESSLFVEPNNLYLQKIKNSVQKIINKELVLYGAQGTSDARHFTKVGIDGIEFGPIGGGIGTDDEWVDIVSLDNYCNILEDFLLSICDDVQKNVHLD